MGDVIGGVSTGEIIGEVVLFDIIAPNKIGANNSIKTANS
ncbi:MAG: hypothetical protein ACI9NY_001533 [Kiritimatiellia bacterium]